MRIHQRTLLLILDKYSTYHNDRKIKNYLNYLIVGDKLKSNGEHLGVHPKALPSTGFATIPAMPPKTPVTNFSPPRRKPSFTPCGALTACRIRSSLKVTFIHNYGFLRKYVRISSYEYIQKIWNQTVFSMTFLLSISLSCYQT